METCQRGKNSRTAAWFHPGWTAGPRVPGAGQAEQPTRLRPYGRYGKDRRVFMPDLPREKPERPLP
jgi:hypothetical protein